MTRSQRQHKYAKDNLEDAKKKAQSIIEQAEWQRSELAEWARDSDNRQMASPTASDNTIRMDAVNDALRLTYNAIERISVPSHVGVEDKTKFYERIQQLRSRKTEMDRRENLDGKEQFARDVIELIEEVQEWQEEMEEEYTI